MDALTWKILRKRVEITIGGRSVVAAEIEQIVEVRPEDTKFNRLLEILGQMYNGDPKCLTFNQQEAANKLLLVLSMNINMFWIYSEYILNMEYNMPAGLRL